jgi:hypothetical protein
MAKYSANMHKTDPQQEKAKQQKAEVAAWLQGEGVEDAGVGVSFNRNTQNWQVSVHTEHSLPAATEEKLHETWHNVEVENVGRVVPY